MLCRGFTMCDRFPICSERVRNHGLRPTPLGGFFWSFLLYCFVARAFLTRTLSARGDLQGAGTRARRETDGEARQRHPEGCRQDGQGPRPTGAREPARSIPPPDRMGGSLAGRAPDGQPVFWAFGPTRTERARATPRELPQVRKDIGDRGREATGGRRTMGGDKHAV